MACKRSAVRSRLVPPFELWSLSPSSRGLGHCPFTAVTGVRIPLGMPVYMKLASLLTWAKGLNINMTHVRILLAKELGLSFNHTFTQGELDVSGSSLKQKLMLLQTGYPLDYIMGSSEFMGVEYYVNEHTLLPRSETASLVRQIVSRHKKINSILELGVGSGAISISLARELEAKVDGVDLCEHALKVANKNLEQAGSQNVKFWQSNWFSNVTSSYDLIFSNPPYCDREDPYLTSTRYEPISAIVSAEQGYKDLKHIIANSVDYLRNNGWLYVEHGYDQSEQVIDMFLEHQYTDVGHLIDDHNIRRGVYGRKPD